MNKAITTSIMMLIIACLFVTQNSLSTASYTNGIAINMMGSIDYGSTARTHVIAYVETFTDERADFIGKHFEAVIVGFESSATVGKIKDYNSKVIILGYRNIMAMHTYYEDWNEVDLHEDWFLHDVYGNRLVHKHWGWYAMDVGNIGWQTHYADFVKSKIERSPFDGVFADDVWDTFPAGSGWNPWTVPIEDVSTEIKNRWHSDMLSMIEFVKAAIGNKMLIVNTSSVSDYVDASDGMMKEGFVHPSWWSTDNFLDEKYWKDHVEGLKNACKKGKYYFAHGGTIIPENATEAELDEVHKIMIYCFSSYLLAVIGEKATFGFNNIQSKDGSLGHYSEFDVQLGFPVNEYYSDGSVYIRDFTRGKVLVNPTNSTHLISLELEYRTMEGEAISSIVLSEHSGAILLKP